jgi:hypothetical protein
MVRVGRAIEARERGVGLCAKPASGSRAPKKPAMPATRRPPAPGAGARQHGRFVQGDDRSTSTDVRCLAAGRHAPQASRAATFACAP